MTFKKRLLAIVAACAAPNLAAMAVTVTATNGGGPTPQQLAQNIADGINVTVVANSAATVINDGSSTLSSPRSIGTFANGLTTPGTQLPAANGGSPTVTYAGGLGVASGVCLSTGVVTNGDIANPSVSGRGIGVEGPNNGISPPYGGINDTASPGEISEQILGIGIIDADFDEAVFGGLMATQVPNSGDPVVLQFEVEITSPGFLSVRTIFGSDEYDQYIEAQYNDSFAILIKNECTEYENIAILVDGGMTKPFTLKAIEECGAPHFLENQVAPQPVALPPSPHAIDKNSDGVGDAADGIPWYDHEFGGFTSLRTWETRCPLAPGIYTIKFVVHDVGDAQVDAGLFIQQNSLKLFSFLPADFNLDGTINGNDFLIWQRNFGRVDAKFIDGDANGDCTVNSADLTILTTNWGAAGGNGNYQADFDRDGDVDSADLAIWSANFGLQHCASRFEGDANGDGVVDGSDFLIWQNGYSGATAPLGCGEVEAMRGVGDEATPLDGSEFDLDNDGEISLEEAQAWLSEHRIAE